jgi:DNA-binding MarR family transcriptional regulator
VPKLSISISNYISGSSTRARRIECPPACLEHELMQAESGSSPVAAGPPGSGTIDVYKEVLVALRQILRTTASQSKRLARETGLTTAQFVSLQAIGGAGEMSAGDLARALNLTQATVTAVVTRLERRGLIARRRAEQDKRRVIVSLTASGEALLAAAPTSLQARLAERFGALAPWEQLHILAAVQRLAALMDATPLEAAPVLDAGSIADTEPG